MALAIVGIPWMAFKIESQTFSSSRMNDTVSEASRFQKQSRASAETLGTACPFGNAACF
jgi:hypothetical protein